MEFSGRQRSKQELNVAPLIDVVFLLLIFFMLASTFIEPKSVELMLGSGTTQTVTAVDPLEIDVATDGSIRLNGLRLSVEQLTVEIAARIKGDPNRIVTIRAEAEIPVQRLIQVMDQVRSAGTNKLRLSAPEAS
mgnify:FL=1